MSDETLILYRPLGSKELALVAASGYRSWPPRLPEQPFFYPVENEQYAREIAEAWNKPADGASYVARFRVRRSCMEKYALRRVGGAHHLEWWIPASDLEELNNNIVGLIEVTGEFS